MTIKEIIQFFYALCHTPVDDTFVLMERLIHPLYPVNPCDGRYANGSK